MMLRLMNEPVIDNLGHYSAKTVGQLRNLLLSGTQAVPDPHRANFFDLDDGRRVFYVHLRPTGKILLIASWPKSVGDESSGM